MKLIMAIVHKSDMRAITEKMLNNGFSLTRIGSNGGLIKRMITIISAVSDERVDLALDVLKDATHGRKYLAKEQEAMRATRRTGVVLPNSLTTAEDTMPSHEIVVGGATVFVLPIEKTCKF